MGFMGDGVGCASFDPGYPWRKWHSGSRTMVETHMDEKLVSGAPHFAGIEAGAEDVCMYVCVCVSYFVAFMALAAVFAAAA